MLRLQKIVKNYKVADTEVQALKGVDLSFRKSEFVSILGPSGCGKTTMLNIIGGLDKYTSGDLHINGKSTKAFSDRDWDVYRNHRVGFIFQSYNLIPHQTILGNVELALTIAGIKKEERIRRAKKAIDRVGLKGQYYKKPNQLSGGQCQRVAIARALVNEPEILLADEPTGALDTQTSVQIMELIKEISKDKLVIMVTHNPELANKYSTRIINLLDGEVLADSNPFSETEEIKEVEKLKDEVNEDTKKKEKAKMSFGKAFRLSLRNLYSKMKRTMMVIVAGSIGIVGVSAVLAFSTGIQTFISSMENDMLSGNPVYITSSTLDYATIMGSSMEAMLPSGEDEKEEDTSKAFVNSLVESLTKMNGVTTQNSITQEYMDFLEKMPDGTCDIVKYNYGYQISPNLFTDFRTNDGKTHQMSISAIQATYASVLNEIENLSDYAAMIKSVSVMTEIPSDSEYLLNQYDVVYIEDGYDLEKVLNDKTSLIAVVSQNGNTLNDLELAEYGYFSQEQFVNYCYKVSGDKAYNPNPMLQVPEYIEYDTLAQKTFTWYPNDVVYTRGNDNEDLGAKFYASAYADGTLANKTDAAYENYRRDAFMKGDDTVDLNVKCVLKLKPSLHFGCLSSGGLYYTNELSKHIRDYTYGNSSKGIGMSEIVDVATSQQGIVYNLEMGFEFRFSSEDPIRLDSTYLSENGGMMDYIGQLLGGASNKKVHSYALSSLGGSKFPQSIFFYCSDFEKKQTLTDYLDVWNKNSEHNLYQIDTNGFYIEKVEHEDGTEETLYYYRDEDTNKYYRINVDEDGFAKDKKGNQYRISKDSSGHTGFYMREADMFGEKFTMDGTIVIDKATNTTVNAYSILSSDLLGDKLSENNSNFGFLTAVEGKGDLIYSIKHEYEDGTSEYSYYMKVPRKNYYEVMLDKSGNVLSKSEGYTQYRYNELDNSFYELSYKESEGKYEKIETLVEYDEQSKVYASDDAYSYANVAKDPKYTIFGNEYTLLTNGLYVDLSSIQGLSQEDITVNQDDYTVTINDYSKFKFYYLDTQDTGVDYFEVEFDEDGYLLSKNNVRTFIELYYGDNLDQNLLDSYFSDRYLIEETGELKCVNMKFSDNAQLVSELINKGILLEELTDLERLSLDDSLKIQYTDMIGLIITMVNTLIDIVTYALIVFTSLSLVVSTVMIGIITYVSVVERIKEIGVIRSLGGRKKDVANLFIAETFIIGTLSGLFGIGITAILAAIANSIIGSLSGVYNIAILRLDHVLLMIGLSMVLTLISGVMPARAAAGKDPVNALRSE